MKVTFSSDKIYYLYNFSQENPQPRTQALFCAPSVRWEKTIELVDIECVLGDVSGVQILPL